MLSLNDFCWKFYLQPGQQQPLILKVHTVPGLAPALASTLRVRGIRCRAEGVGIVRVGHPRSILALMQALEVAGPDLLADLERYAVACGVVGRGEVAQVVWHKWCSHNG